MPESANIVRLFIERGATLVMRSMECPLGIDDQRESFSCFSLVLVVLNFGNV